MISGYPPVLPPLQGPVDGIVSMGSMQPLHPGVPPPHQLPPGMPGIPGIPPPGKSLILIPPWFHCHVLGLTHSYRSSCSLFCSCLWFVSTAEYEGCAEHWTTACPLSPQDKGAGEMWCCSSRSFVPAKITLIVLEFIRSVKSWNQPVHILMSFEQHLCNHPFLIWSGLINEIYCSHSLPKSFSVCLCQTALNWAWSCKTPWPLGQ